MIKLYELIIKLVAYLFPISLGVGVYGYSNENYIIAIFGFFGGAIISALVCGFFLTILEINNTLKKILDLLDSKIGNEKNQEILSFLSFFIDKFYNELFLLNNKKIYNNFFNYKKIINIINNMKRFNLDEKSAFITVKGILINETK